MNLPFGLRLPEHTLWIRSSTHTTTNDDQSHGVALAYSGNGWRGEVMGVAGNLQLHPDALRERGYSAYVEWAPAPLFTVGASSLALHADQDMVLGLPRWRQAHGLFSRWALFERVAVMGESDLLLSSQPNVRRTRELVSALILDTEPLRGVHLVGTAESQCDVRDSTGCDKGLWGSVVWFFAPHTDLRFDLMWRQFAASPGSPPLSGIAQLHFYL
jgi:hypothetical protein